MRLAGVLGATRRWGEVSCRTLLRALSISGRQHDLKLIELIPLGVRPFSFRNS
jgi:hypothetical protein